MGALDDERFRLYVKTNDDIRDRDFGAAMENFDSIMIMCRGVESDQKENGRIYKAYADKKNDLEKQLQKRMSEIATKKKEIEGQDPIDAGNFEKNAMFEVFLWHVRTMQKHVFDVLLKEKLLPREIREKTAGEIGRKPDE